MPAGAPRPRSANGTGHCPARDHPKEGAPQARGTGNLPVKYWPKERANMLE